MLSKLLKYEFKATARIFLLTYGALVALALVNAGLITLRTTSSALSGSSLYGLATTLMMMLYGLAAVAVVIVTLIIILVRFYRMLGDEGHLWFTLPVTATQHILSKLIVAFVWMIASLVVVIASVALVVLPTAWYQHLGSVGSSWNALVAQGFNPGAWTVVVLALLVISLVCSILEYYAAMAIGPNLLKSRLGGSVLTYVIFYFALELINLGVLMVLSFGVSGKFSNINFAISDTGMLSTETASAINRLVSTTSLTVGVEYLVLAVVFFCLARYFMTRKLNLA
ncbi:MAG: hypothetical protein FWD65_07805 [Coriobacteriia bacterium]|nr:hypothetical protein [Coriobacteriia bacterium]